MIRFALFTARRDRAERVTARKPALRAAGLRRIELGTVTLFVDPAAPVALDARRGIAIIGTAFATDDDRPIAFGPEVDLGACQVAPQSAAPPIWGACLVITTLGDSVALYRDPSGGCPAYHTSSSDGALIASDLSMLTIALGARPAIDWSGVDAHLRFASFRGRRTALDGVSEILPGECVVLGEPWAARMLWQPPPCDDRLTDAAHAARLRAAICRSVGAFAAAHKRVQLELSGGLDSAIVALALAATRAPPGAARRAVTLVTSGGDGDERDYARAAASAAGLDHHEIAAGPPLFGDGASVDVRPPRHGLLGAANRALGAAADAWDADALLTGAGGDALFGLLGASSPVVDAWHAGGHRRALATASAIAAVTRVSVPSVLAAALRRAMRSSRASGWPGDARFLRDGGASFEGHPWLDAVPAATPGRRAHVAAVLTIYPFLDAFARGRDRPMIAPLMMRPVLEAAFATPVWRTSQGGRDRAVARCAFATDLPPLILNRRGKGKFAVMLGAGFAATRPALRDLLLGGRLADAAIIDAAAVEAALARLPHRDDHDHVRLGELADAELWARAVAG